MTKQESFKQRVRARMAHTGERYNAARRVLIQRAQYGGPGRTWISDPEVPDASVSAATGRAWDEWCDLIDAAGVDPHDHKALVAFARDRIDPTLVGDKMGWWSQGVAVGYERITGVRLPHQRADGSFVASKSRTMTLDVAALRDLLVSDDGRRELFPGHQTTLVSRATAKALRVGFDQGVALVSLDPLPDGRTRVTVSHERLDTPEDVGIWKAYWADWLDALATVG